tara:strand:+ start:288 stop:764 length:477 start_codon:yes stop_codon:yes gene_type:complete
MVKKYPDGTTGVGPVADGAEYARRVNQSNRGYGSRFVDNFKSAYLDAFKNQSKGSSSDDDEESKNPLITKVDNFTSTVAPGLSIYKEGGQAMVIPGQQGQESFLGGLARTAAGAAVTAGISSLCDVRVKEDISPLQTTEINDQLAEFAFFVKDLNECS